MYFFVSGIPLGIDVKSSESKEKYINSHSKHYQTDFVSFTCKSTNNYFSFKLCGSMANKLQLQVKRVCYVTEATHRHVSKRAH